MYDPIRVTPRRGYRFPMAIAVILVLAALLRFYGQDWDEGHYFHPDERFIATVVDGRLSIPGLSDFHLLFNPEQSPLNTRSDDENGEPRQFAYGSLPFIVATLVAGAIGLVWDIDLTSYQHVWQFGRTLTALVDLGTIGLVILFARREFGELAAVIAGLLTTSSVILIQLAHFFTVDTWVTFFTIAVLYACLPIIKCFDFRWSLIAAGLGGAAIATKASVGLLGIPIIVAMVLGVRSVTTERFEAGWLLFRRLAICAVPAVAAFALFEPYAIWRPGTYVGDIRTQWEIVNGHVDIPFTRQFVGTTAGITEIENLVLWGLAPGFGLAALVATATGVYWCFRKRDPRYLLLMAWIVPYFYIIASSEARFLRYAAPLVPPLAIIVGHQLSLWWQRTDGFRARRMTAGSAIAAVLGITLIWALAFMTVYTGTHPRIEASEWIYENVEPGSTLTREVWDDTLPVRLSATQQPGYDHLSLDLYGDRPNDEAFEYIVDFLHQADYIVLSSQRLSHSIPRLPWRYPVESAYYRLLEDEKLGYELAHEATNYPGFGPLRINTLRADESFSVYDHPPVRIFRKVEELTVEELELRFAHALNQPWIPEREPPEPTLMLDEPVDRLSAATDAGWSSSITSFSPFAILIWITTLAVVGGVALPVSVHLFPKFTDAGIGFSYLIGLLGIGILVWLGWSLDLAPFNVWTILIATLVLGTVAWVVVGTPSLEMLAGRWPLILAGQLVFVSVFAIFILIRAINPDLWHPVFGGEKPMETAYLNAVAHSQSFPPYDPWFADGYINYYYYGFFLSAILWKVTGIPPDIAFQLTLATVAGLLAIGVFSLGSTLAGSVLQTSRRLWLIGGGALTVLLTVFAGNLDATRQILDGRSLDIDFWQSSRVVAFAINEFPYFSFLYGDLHPHVIAAPVLVLIIALAYTWIQSSADRTVEWLTVWTVATSIAIGSIVVINFWDGPTAAVVITAGMVFPLLRKTSGRARQLGEFLMVAPMVCIAAWFLFYQFHIRFSSETGGFDRTSSGTATSEWFAHFGGLLAPVLLVVGVALWRVFRSERHRYAIAKLRSRNLALVAMVPFIALGALLALFYPVASISAFLVALFLSLFFSNPNRDGAILVAICGASAAGLVLTADLIYVADHLRNSDWERMNTVFKLYFQAWTLFAIAAGAAGVWLIHRLVHRHQDGSTLHWTSTRIGTFAGIGLVLVLLAYPLFATPDRLNERMASSPAGLTLAGYEWMDDGTLLNNAGDVIDFTGDYEAIEWLRENADRNAVILEASIGPYRGGGSRISSATGMPAVLGWDSHQSQQRGNERVRPRVLHVREIYRADDVDRKRYLLRQYNVDYVVVGDVERYSTVGDVADDGQPEYYASESGIEAFREMLGDDLEIAFEAEGTTIYRVIPFPRAGESS